MVWQRARRPRRTEGLTVPASGSNRDGLDLSASFVARRLEVNSQSQSLPVEGLPFNAKSPCRLRSVSTCLFQTLEDMLSFQFHKPIWRRGNRLLRRLALRSSLRFGFHIRQRDLPCWRKNGQTVHGVFQLAHVTGPAHLL